MGAGAQNCLQLSQLLQNCLQQHKWGAHPNACETLFSAKFHLPSNNPFSPVNAASSAAAPRAL